MLDTRQPHQTWRLWHDESRAQRLQSFPDLLDDQSMFLRDLAVAEQRCRQALILDLVLSPLRRAGQCVNHHGSGAAGRQSLGRHSHQRAAGSGDCEQRAVFMAGSQRIEDACVIQLARSSIADPAGQHELFQRPVLDRRQSAFDPFRPHVGVRDALQVDGPAGVIRSDERLL